MVVDEDVVFHYTNASGALGILTSKEIWTTLVYHLNDVQEAHYAQGLALQLVHESVDLIPEDHRGAFIERFRSTQAQVRQTHIFAASFSKNQDVLSQWRGYAGSGGYALGFSVAALESVASELVGVRTGHVCYDRTQQRKMLQPAISDLIDSVGSTPIESISREGLNPFWKAVMRIASVAPLIKHPGFAEEEEWRIYTDASKRSDRQYDFIVKDGELVPIFKIKLKTVDKKNGRVDIGLRHIATGPGDHLERRSNAILSLLYRYGIDFDMGINSQTPYR